MNPVKLSELYSPKELYILNSLQLNKILLQCIFWYPIKNYKTYDNDNGGLDSNGWRKYYKLYGPYKSYDTNGKISIYDFFKNNEYHGKCTSYYFNKYDERIKNEEYYDYGICYKIMTYFKSGKIINDTHQTPFVTLI